MHRTFRLVFRTAIVAVLFGLPAYAEEPIVLKFSHVTAADSPKGKAALRFKAVAEKRTNGRVKVEVYADGSLYTEKDEVDGLLTGKVQMLAPPFSRLEALGIKEFALFSVPYLFAGDDVLHRIQNGRIGQDVLKKLESKEIVGLGYWDNGFKSMSANRPLHRPEDFRGLKMRIATPTHEPLMRALGATPIQMPYADVYQALKTGKVDGSDNVPANLYTSKMHEVQKHITVSNHVYLGYVLITNKKFWNGLPPNIRAQLKIAAADATHFADLYAEQENDEALAKIKASGKSEVYELSAEERGLWHKALLPVRKEFEPKVGKGLLDEVGKESDALGYKKK